MSLPRIITLRNAVAAILNAEAFTPKFKAEPRILPKYQLENLDQIEVHVVPGNIEMETVSRGGATKDDPIIDIAVLKMVKDVEAETPGLIKLVEDIIEFWKPRRKSEAGTLVEITLPTLFSPKHLHDEKLFLSVVRLRFGRIG